MSLANAAIEYFAEAFSTSGKRLMGREVASEAFLHAFFKHAQVEEYYCFAAERNAAERFAAVSRVAGSDRPVHWIARDQPLRLASPGCLFRADPVLGRLAWQRRHVGDAAYSLCGVTHTICTAAVMDSISEMVTAPIYPWDAVICTSQVVQTTVVRVWEAWGEYLRERLSASVPPAPQLPVIPLGVDCAAFDDPHAPHTRLEVRRELGIDADAIVVLYMGRLSFHAKAHPWQMYLALERAAQRARQSLWLVQAGWFANAAIEAEFKSSAQAGCPRVKCVFVDGNQPHWRRRIWQAADIFISLADNIQETFGLSPVEAMAAGLPVVVSDWNGYRDTVRQGLDGFRVPTIMAPAGAGGELAARYARGDDDYDRYIGTASLCTAIDVEACAEAIARLVNEPALRASLGASGKTRAREKYDWKHVIRAYQELWHDLAARRAAAPASSLRTSRGDPLRPDPFELFATYPSAPLSDSTLLERVSDADERLAALYGRPMLNFAPAMFLSIDASRQLLERLNAGPRMAAELLDEEPIERRFATQRTLLWLLKGGVLALRRPRPDESSR